MDVFATSEGTIVQLKVRNEAYVAEDTLLLVYKTTDGNDVQVKAPSEGIVVFEKGVNRNLAVDEGTLLAKITTCSHDVVMKDMCANCGKDLREREGRAGQRKEAAAANVSMIHHVPELHVSNSLAQTLGSEDQQRLLNSRKLVLLVDLDQTIIHTTNRLVYIPSDQESNDIFKYIIAGVEYTTKLRPHTREFLDSMSKLYELHIITYGQRLYAHTIAENIQKGKRYFDQRVLSRDELFSAQHKTNNLKALFPCGEQLIAIIDDRADVWQYSEALVQVKPYRYFREVGDINAPPGSPQHQIPADIEKAADDDTCLHTLEKVLTDVHRNFYAHYDRTRDIRDVKVVIAYLKKQVFRDLVIVLSGVVPMGIELERCDAYRLCLQFGARVEKSVTEQTTHVIAARWGTEKVHLATRKQIPVVSCGWLYASIELWHKADEKQYELTKDALPPKGTPKGGHLIPEIHCIDTMKKSDIRDMEHEVDEALSGEDEDDDEESNDEEDKDKNDTDLDSEQVEGQIEDKRKKRRASVMGDDFMDEEDTVEKKNCLRDEYQDDDGEHYGLDDPPDEDDEETNDVPVDSDEDEEDDEMAAEIERQMSHDEGDED